MSSLQYQPYFLLMLILFKHNVSDTAEVFIISWLKTVSIFISVMS